MVGQQAQHNRDAGEYQHDLLLVPAAHLEVVVQRRHLEDALAVGGLEVGDLQDNGQRFDDVDQADQQQDERHFTRNARPATAPPRNREPVSPMNTLAGLKL